MIARATPYFLLHVTKSILKETRNVTCVARDMHILRFCTHTHIHQSKGDTIVETSCRKEFHGGNEPEAGGKLKKILIARQRRDNVAG